MDLRSSPFSPLDNHHAVWYRYYQFIFELFLI